MMTTQQRLTAVANFYGIRSERLRASDVDGQRQFDVFVDAPSGMFRLGYFDGDAFTQENPVMRALHRYGVHVAEGAVSFTPGDHANGRHPEPVGWEPQYDAVIWFGPDGEALHISNQRIAMEAEA